MKYTGEIGMHIRTWFL